MKSWFVTFELAAHPLALRFPPLPPAEFEAYGDGAEKWYAALEAHPDYLAFALAAQRRKPLVHMLEWRSTLRADGTGLYHHQGRPVRIWAVSIDPGGPTFHETANTLD